MDDQIKQCEVVLKPGQKVKVEIDGHSELYEVQATGIWLHHAIVFREVFVELHSLSTPVRVIRLSAHPRYEQYR